MTGRRRGPARRQALQTAGGVAAATGLAACGSTTSSTSTTSGATSGSTGTTGAGGSLATVATSDVPVGGGTIDAAAKVVVTQPSAGEFKAFSAVCTHQGCIVADVSTTIDCACHGSKFSITDGSVVAGPARSALPAKAVSVSGNTVTVS